MVYLRQVTYKAPIAVLFLFLLGQIACEPNSEKTLQTSAPPEIVRDTHQFLGTLSYPKNNAPSIEAVELGKLLFFDTALSKDSTRSCSSCHLPQYAFSDTITLSIGVADTSTRNSPSLLNVAYHPYFFREGGMPTLERQALSPITTTEMNMTVSELVIRLKQNSNYVKLATEAYAREIDAFVITRALGAFQRTLLSKGSRYDAFINGDSNQLSHTEQDGMELFFSKDLNCAVCHKPPHFSTFEILNNGTYLEYQDPGLGRETADSLDIGKFKMPSLRNVSLTAPYMFDGSFADLDQVVEHYSNGGLQHPNQSKLITGFSITDLQKEQLISFLNALEDTVQYSFSNNIPAQAIN